MWRNSPLIRTQIRKFSNTVDSGEVQHFKKLSEDWWNELGGLRALHSMNKLRIPLIRDGIVSSKSQTTNQASPLKEISLLEVGCGGGILTEPLARIGGSVTGIDPTCDLIETAKLRKKDLKIEYLCTTVEEHAVENREKYDAVIASEVLEHITEKKEFLEECLRCLKPGGSFFLTTMSKTWLSKIAGITIAEAINLVPKGTHQHEKFIEPHQLEKILEDLNCKTVLVHGMFYNLVTNRWSWCSDTSINYALHAIKLKN